MRETDAKQQFIKQVTTIYGGKLAKTKDPKLIAIHNKTIQALQQGPDNYRIAIYGQIITNLRSKVRNPSPGKPQQRLRDAEIGDIQTALRSLKKQETRSDLIQGMDELLKLGKSKDSKTTERFLELVQRSDVLGLSHLQRPRVVYHTSEKTPASARNQRFTSPTNITKSSKGQGSLSILMNYKYPILLSIIFTALAVVSPLFLIGLVIPIVMTYEAYSEQESQNVPNNLANVQAQDEIYTDGQGLTSDPSHHTYENVGGSVNPTYALAYPQKPPAQTADGQTIQPIRPVGPIYNRLEREVDHGAPTVLDQTENQTARDAATKATNCSPGHAPDHVSAAKETTGDRNVLGNN